MPGPGLLLKSGLRCALRLCTWLGLLLVLITCTPAVNWYSHLLAGPWTDPRGEVLIVLGGDVIGGGIIGESSYWRAVYAVRAWREGGFEEIILTANHSISDPMKRFLISEGVPESVIRLESAADNTRQNAIFTRNLIRANDTRKMVLLTSDYHMYRAWRAFRKAGLETLPRPFPDALKRGQRWRYRWDVFLEVALESGKIVYYTARGWI